MMRILSMVVILTLSLAILPVYGASNLKFFNFSSYIDSGGAPVIFGEVVNDGREAIKSVEVKATFIDPSGRLLDSESTLVAIDVIPPGQRAPFKITGAVEYAFDVKSFELQVVNFSMGQSKPAKLEIINTSEFSDGLGEVSIWGEVSNNGDKTATMTKIYATFYDMSGRVIGFTSVNTDSDSIAINAKSSFTLKIHERVPLIESYTLYAESEQFSTAPYGVRSVGNPTDIGSKISVSRLSLIDQQGTEIGKIIPGDRVWIKSDLKNRLPVEQEFTYIVQIKDKDGFPVELKWIDGVLASDMLGPISISWLPEEEGVYFAEVFVWNSMNNPIPLSASIKTIILFVST